MRYMEAEEAWLCADPEGRDIEILVAGTRTQANAARLAFVESVLAEFESVAAAAKGFLDEFVDRSRFAEGGEWFIEGISSTLPDGEEQFTVQLTIESDTYGFWTVKFRSDVGRYWPISFTRTTY